MISAFTWERGTRAWAWNIGNQNKASLRVVFSSSTARESESYSVTPKSRLSGLLQGKSEVRAVWTRVSPPSLLSYPTSAISPPAILPHLPSRTGGLTIPTRLFTSHALGLVSCAFVSIQRNGWHQFSLGAHWPGEKLLNFTSYEYAEAVQIMYCLVTFNRHYYAHFTTHHHRMTSHPISTRSTCHLVS